jgi:hypothetical protein
MSAADNIKIRQTWIDEEKDKCANELRESKDTAFLFFIASLLLDCSLEDIDAEDVVDGGQDKQIDFIHIEDDQEKSHAQITIIQS